MRPKIIMAGVKNCHLGPKFPKGLANKPGYGRLVKPTKKTPLPRFILRGAGRLPEHHGRHKKNDKKRIERKHGLKVADEALEWAPCRDEEILKIVGKFPLCRPGLVCVVDPSSVNFFGHGRLVGRLRWWVVIPCVGQWGACFWSNSSKIRHYTCE